MSDLQESVAALRAQLEGPVYLRGESGYRDEAIGFNTTAPTNPDLVVGAAHEADIQVAVRWAKEHGITVHPQATGHGAYRRLNHGMLLNTSRLNQFTIDAEKRRWSMGSGMRWRQILPHLAEAGLGAVTGSSGSVGAVGLTLGGGIGPIGRTFGMSADWVRGYRVVDADGEVLVVSPDSHPDLFWALRGGKVGLGVVSEITFEALPMPFLYAGGIYYRESEINRLFHHWVDWVQNLPESVSTSVAIVRLPESVPAPLGGGTWFHFRFAYVNIGASEEQYVAEGEALLESWRDFAGESELDHIGLISSDRVGEIHRDPTDPMPLWEYGTFLRDLDHDLADALLPKIGTGQVSPLANIEIRYHGGAYTRDSEVPSAIGGRQEPFTFVAVGHPDAETLMLADVEKAAFELRDIVKPWQGQEVNYNWANPLTREIFETRLWSETTRDRLKEVRKRYDPDTRFEHEFSS